MTKIKKMVMQAVARGWCYRKTSKKIMDTDLAEAITTEMIKGQDAVPNAIRIFGDAIKKDKNFYYTYQANIAMAFKDEYWRKKKKYMNNKDVHNVANRAAKNFLNLLFGIKESKK